MVGTEFAAALVDVARARGEAPHRTMGLVLEHWDGVAFDRTALAMAESYRAYQVERIGKAADKDSMGIDVIANLLGTLARRA